MTVTLQDVINLTGGSIGYRRSSSTRVLDKITNSINTATGYVSNKFVLDHNRDGNTSMHIYDAGSWYLTIILRQDWKEDLVQSWYIMKNNRSYSIVFDVDKIWFFSLDNTLSHGGAAHAGWVVFLYRSRWSWEPISMAPFISLPISSSEEGEGKTTMATEHA